MGKIKPKIEIMPRITAKSGQLFSIPFRLVNAVGVTTIAFSFYLHPEIEVKKFEAGKQMRREWFNMQRFIDGVNIICSLPNAIKVPNQPLGALRVLCRNTLSYEINFLDISVNGDSGNGEATKSMVYIA